MSFRNVKIVFCDEDKSKQNISKFPCFGIFQNSLPKKPGFFPGLNRVFSTAHNSTWYTYNK
jgi:hypothetical protein